MCWQCSAKTWYAAETFSREQPYVHIQVSEHQMRLKDSQTGHEEIMIGRQLGDKVTLVLAFVVPVVLDCICHVLRPACCSTVWFDHVCGFMLCAKPGRSCEIRTQSIGDPCLQARTVTKRCQADGTQSQQQHLRNLAEQEADHFDEEWTYEAERSLPMYMRNSGLPQASRTNMRPAVGYRC